MKTPSREIYALARYLFTTGFLRYLFTKVYLVLEADLEVTSSQRYILEAPTWKSLPNDDRRYVPKPEPNVFSSLKYELAAFAMTARLFNQKAVDWHPGMLWSKRTLYPLDSN